MKLEKNNYVLFSLPDNQLVAIDRENQKVLDHCLGIWKEFSKVPLDRTVRGVFVKNINGELDSVDETAQQNDITINQLRNH
jgi:hypothetical protein